MATLVLSSLGTAVGGPIGGLIGGLLGQSIDRSLFAAGPRAGPRLGDLAVQTSSYGNPVPRIYGKMRVAGTVVWATPLKESQQLVGGAKGQTGTLNYAYSVSLAVALSSRTATGVGRIWADGKLLRGSAGDFKTRTGFRFHTGDGDQALDPLIGAIEGLLATPAYRGTALAVFEDLDLAPFGNRIPVLTFELLGDAEPPSLGAVLADASKGDVRSGTSTKVSGFAAHGLSVRDGVGGLVETFGLNLHDDGRRLVEPTVSPARIVQAIEIDCGQADGSTARTHRRQEPANTLPTRISLSYYDPERDFQAGQKQASMSGGGRRLRAIDLPAAMSAESARSLAEQIMARSWGERDRLRVSLPTRFLNLQVGQTLSLPGEPALWIVESVDIERLVVKAELKPLLGQFVQPSAVDAGRIIKQVDVLAAPTVLALLDLPAFELPGSSMDSPTLALAASRTSAGWSPVPVTYSISVEEWVGRTAARRAVMGRTRDVLGPGGSCLLDCTNSFEVELTGDDDWLQSCDDEALAGRFNLLVVEQEIVQFGEATPLGQRRFRLRRLMRGRGGTEWAGALHSVGERVVLLDGATLAEVPVPSFAIGATLSAAAGGLGDSPSDAPQTMVISGEALRLPRPVHLRAITVDAALPVTWVRRSRFGWSWSDGMEAPLGESTEQYRVILRGPVAAIERFVAVPSCLFTNAERLSVGSGTVTATVEQIGTRGLSRPSFIDLS